MLILILALMQTIAAQQPAAPQRDVRAVAPAHGSASIVGVVMSDASQPQPIRHARVACVKQGERATQATLTDDSGHFACTALGAGNYVVSVSKPAWVSTSYGAKRLGRGGTPIALKNGEQASLTLRLVRGAVITGTVTDEGGQPAVGVNVRAMTYSWGAGERRLQTTGPVSFTDEHGVYRMYGLAPGDYFVSASQGIIALRQSALRLTTDLDLRYAADPRDTPPPPERTVDVSPTFYPGTAVVSEAAAVSVHAGEERTGVDFGLVVVPTTTIRGTVTLPDGTTPSPTQLTLIGSSQTIVPAMPFSGFHTGRAGRDGTFSMSDITPGDYTLIAKATVPATGGAAPSIVYAATPLNVQGEPIGSLSLILEPAMTLSGRLRFDGSLPVPDPKAIRITLQPGADQGATLLPAPAVVNADGSFTMSGVTPGAYRFTVLVPGAGRAESWHVRSATLNGRNALDLPVTISSSQILSDAVIEFTDRVASLSGALRTSSGSPAPGYTVILFPTDQTLWLPRSRRITVSRPGPDGSFHFDAFPGGEYYLAAVDDVEPGEWFDPSFLQTLVSGATKVTIADGEKKVQDLTVGGANVPLGFEDLPECTTEASPGQRHSDGPTRSGVERFPGSAKQADACFHR